MRQQELTQWVGWYKSVVQPQSWIAGGLSK